MPKTHRVCVRVSDEEFEALESMTKMHKCTLSEAFRLCLDALIEESDRALENS